MSAPSTAIVWLRRDLRLHDHPALTQALAAHDRVVPLFVVDEALLGGRFASAPRTAFMLACLRELDADLRERGSGLVVRQGRDVVRELLGVVGETGAAAVYWTSEPGPYARGRDRAATAALEEQGVDAVPCPGSYCADIGRPRTSGGKPFGVFTPFWKAQARLDRRTVHRAPRAMPALPSSLAKGRLPGADALDLPGTVRQPIREPGEAAARAAVAAWLAGPVDRYHERHDDLTGGTSELSPYLRWGCMSARELEERAMGREGPGAAAFVRQLAWRDFYAHVLLHFPGNARHEYQERFRDLEWEDDPDLLDAWKAGMTGYPLVDAGMRQLAATGWMHNRARMVVGSFLTKDLHLDWRAGEAHFEELLLDGEPAQNNGNWQWIASTGVDPAPYFRRIFNPVLQQQKFDAEGRYVRRWVPELEGVPDEHLAEPWRLSADALRGYGAQDYPAPVVDHAEERRRAVDRYRAVSGG